MRKIWLFCFVFLLECSLLFATTITHENTTYSVELIAQPSCHTTQTKIFHIENLNYTQNSTPKTLTYQTICAERTTTITKAINKFSQTDTGNCTFTNSTNNTISFLLTNQSLEFFLETICVETNSTMNATAIFSNTTEEQIENNTTTTISSTHHETQCFEQPRIEINTWLFEEGEQLTLNFYAQEEPSEYTITYGISYLNGTSIKSSRNTTNMNTKTHTFSSLQPGERGASVHVAWHDECGTHLTLLPILLLGEQVVEENTQEEVSLEPSLDITSIEVDREVVEIEFTLSRGKSRSSVVYLEIRDQDKSLLGKEKYKFLSSESSVEVQSVFPLDKDATELEITLYGLGIEETKVHNVYREEDEDHSTSINIIRAYTREKYYEDTLSWSVRTLQNNISFLEINTSLGSVYQKIDHQGEATHTFDIAYVGGDITTTLYHGNEHISLHSTPDVVAQQDKEQRQEEKVNNFSTSQSNVESSKPIIHETAQQEFVLETQKPSKNPIQKQWYLLAGLGALLGGSGIYSYPYLRGWYMRLLSKE